MSKLWAEKIKEILPRVDIIFSSEKYGDYLAEYMNCNHLAYDITRQVVRVSASLIIDNTMQYWDLLASSAKSHFIKKVCITGSESTGKSTMAQKLAKHYNTIFVSEVGREIVDKTNECNPNDLRLIAEKHAKKNLEFSAKIQRTSIHRHRYNYN